jgi:predicted membrane-bound dolichyl-phosphate-mannose-protein mannosyltransferase
VVESVETLTYLRLFPIVMAAVTAVMIGITVSTLSQSTRRIATGTSAGALFLSLRIVQGTAFLTRPDITVGFLCVLFLFLLIREKRLLAEMCLGLALGFHPKCLPLTLGFLLADQVALGLNVVQELPLLDEY